MTKIVRATERDINTILQFITQLAIYEKLEKEVVATPQLLAQYLFGPNPAAEVIFAEVGGKKLGFALFFTSFSTFLGRPGLYLEDLFVMPDARGKGLGKMLLAYLAKTVVDRDYGRLEWSVLDWNKPAIDLYLSLGSVPNDEWTTHRLTGEKLKTLAASYSADADVP